MTSIDLEPWLIAMGNAPEQSLASWSVAETEEPALALFSTRDRAASYAESNCATPYSIVQFDQTSLIRVLANGYSQGMRHAALDPTDSSARQLFVLREVLAAARNMLQQSKMNQEG